MDSFENTYLAGLQLVSKSVKPTKTDVMTQTTDRVRLGIGLTNNVLHNLLITKLSTYTYKPSLLKCNITTLTRLSLPGNNWDLSHTAPRCFVWHWKMLVLVLQQSPGMSCQGCELEQMKETNIISNIAESNICDVILLRCQILERNARNVWKCDVHYKYMYATMYTLEHPGNHSTENKPTIYVPIHAHCVSADPRVCLY